MNKEERNVIQSIIQAIAAFFVAIATVFSTLAGNIFYKQGENEYFYGFSHEMQSVNIVFPENAERSVRGLILFIHGGGWVAGDKTLYDDSLQEAADHGFVAASMNYRFVSASVHVDDLLDDISSAVEKIRSVAEEREIRIKKMLLAGHSAGAHLSLLYGYKCASVSTITPAAVVSLSGPTDFTDPFYFGRSELGTTKYILSLFVKITGVRLTLEDYYYKKGNYNKFIAALKEYSPLNYVDEGSIPTVIAHGEKDNIIPYQNSVDLEIILSKNNVRHDFISFPNSAHKINRNPRCMKIMNEIMYKYADEFLN